ncbi:MAG: hypothetical protein QY314_03915 [Candidatus Dojkabacteria bacterium]|nr:MAG: hypothetical protein QY314_03915 [Candidatus Dojkabacteria bacterium]
MRKAVLVFIVLMLSIGFIPVQAEAPLQAETPTTRVFYGGTLRLENHATLVVNGIPQEGKFLIVYHLIVTTPSEPLSLHTSFAEVWCFSDGCGRELASAASLQLEIWSEYRVQPIFTLDGEITFRNMILGRGTRTFPETVTVREISGFMPDFAVFGSSRDKIYRLELPQ